MRAVFLILLAIVAVWLGVENHSCNISDGGDLTPL